MVEGCRTRDVSPKKRVCGLGPSPDCVTGGRVRRDRSRLEQGILGWVGGIVVTDEVIVSETPSVSESVKDDPFLLSPRPR